MRFFRKGGIYIMKKIHLIDRHKYKIQVYENIQSNLFLEYSGNDCEGDHCDLCGRLLRRGYSFSDTNNGNPHTRHVYGPECVHKVVLEEI